MSGDRTVFYFAYGSNADPGRFHTRVGEWRSRRPARLEGHRLRFASQVRSQGGGGAVEAEAYLVDDDGGWAAPSAAYLDHILRGLAAAGCAADRLDRVRRAAREAGERED
jgi:hypothetical protein